MTATTAAATPVRPDAHAPPLTAAEVGALLGHAGLTLIDFTAAWCAPCKQLAPILADLERAYAGRARIVAVDVHDEPALAQAFRVRSMPTMVLVKGGREVSRMVGLRPRKVVAGALERALRGRPRAPETSSSTYRQRSPAPPTLRRLAAGRRARSRTASGPRRPGQCRSGASTPGPEDRSSGWGVVG